MSRTLEAHAMTRFLVAPVVAVAVLLTGAPAFADSQLPNLGNCVTIREDFTGRGVMVCTPPTN